MRLAEAHARFHHIRYDSSGKNLWNPCMHLCNYSINKYHSDYIKCDDPDQEDQGHKWSLSALLRHLKANGIDTLQLMGSIEDVIIKVHAVLLLKPFLFEAINIEISWFKIRNC